jgi:hypothetical protein
MKSLGFSEEYLGTRRARFLPEADRAVLGTVRCGVLFLMAFWSIYARQAFTELKRVLAEVDPEGHLELLVVDIDGSSELAKVLDFGGMYFPAGVGETAWVKDGYVISTSGFGLHPECFGPNTRALLSQCRAEKS